MIGLSGFKRQKPRQYSYKPLYYDQDKEERELRRGEVISEEYKPGSIVRGMRRSRFVTNDINAKKQLTYGRNRTVTRMLLILFLLGLTAYIIMNSTMLEAIFSVFMNE